MNIPDLAEKLVSIFAPLMIFSVFAIWSYLVRRGVWDFWEHFFLWPKMVIDYRKHTREQLGRAGVLYYVFLTSLFITVLPVVTIFADLVFDPGM